VDSCKYFQQLIGAISHMHQLGIAHRDIKPPNILLDGENNLKLIDFGLGIFYEGKELLNTPCGSPIYSPPELLSGKPYSGELADVWSCGVTLFNMLVGRLPFDSDNKNVLYDLIFSCKYEMPPDLNQNVVRLIRRIFVRDPDKRISIKEITKDRWFNSVNQGKYFVSVTNPQEVVIGTCSSCRPTTAKAVQCEEHRGGLTAAGEHAQAERPKQTHYLLLPISKEGTSKPTGRIRAISIQRRPCGPSEQDRR